MKPPSTAAVKREFRRFLRETGYLNADFDQVWALLQEMRAVARNRGLSDDEVATIYAADDLLDIYRETLDRRH